MTYLSTIELATISGGRNATPAEAAQTTRDAEAYARDIAAEPRGHSVSPQVGQFWSGRREESRNADYANELRRQDPSNFRP